MFRLSSLAARPRSLRARLLLPSPWPAAASPRRRGSAGTVLLTAIGVASAVSVLAVALTARGAPESGAAPLVAAGPAAPAMVADTVVVFGPQAFTSPTGAQTNFVETFTTTPTPGVRYVVIARQTGGTLSAGHVTLNGTIVAGYEPLTSQPEVVSAAKLYE